MVKLKTEKSYPCVLCACVTEGRKRLKKQLSHAEGRTKPSDVKGEHSTTRLKDPDSKLAVNHVYTIIITE